MINAGVELTPWDGNQHYDPDTQMWKGITSKINYPSGQSFANNPVEVGDVLIEPNGQVWDVRGVTTVSASNQTFRLDLYLTSDDPIEDFTPGFGQVRRGGVITPVNGFIAPYWDTNYVDAPVGRIAAMLTMNNMHSLWNGDVDLKKEG